MSEYQIQQIDKLINTLNKSVRQIEFLEKLDEYMGGANRTTGTQRTTAAQGTTASLTASPTAAGLSQLNPSARVTTPATTVAAAQRNVAPGTAAPVATQVAAPGTAAPVAAPGTAAPVAAPGTAASVAAPGTAAPGTAAPGSVAHIKNKVDEIKQLLSAGTGGPKIETEQINAVMQNASELKGNISTFLETMHTQLQNGTNNDEIIKANKQITEVSEEIGDIKNVFGNLTGGELKQLEYQL